MNIFLKKKNDHSIRKPLCDCSPHEIFIMRTIHGKALVKKVIYHHMLAKRLEVTNPLQYQYLIINGYDVRGYRPVARPVGWDGDFGERPFNVNVCGTGLPAEWQPMEADFKTLPTPGHIVPGTECTMARVLKRPVNRLSAAYT